MRNYIMLSRSLLVWLLSISMSLFLMSCSEEDSWERPDDLSPYIPDYAVGSSGSWYVSGGIASFNLEPHVYADFDYWKLQVKSIEYFIDEELIKTDTSEPYSFVYTTVGLEQGKHKFIMKVRIKDLLSGKEIVINPTKEFDVNSNSSESSNSNNGLSMQASWSYSGNNVSFSINSVELTKTLSDTGWELKSVSYYWDEEQIETANEKPFGFHYTAKNMKRGTHYLKVVAKISNYTNGQETELSTTHEVEVGPGINFYVDYNRYIKPGELLTAIPCFLDKRSSGGCQIKSVTYRVDDKTVETKTTAPFALSYNLPQDDKKHKMDVSISYSDGTKASRLYSTTFNDIQFLKPDTHEYEGRWKGGSNFFVDDVLECYAKIYRGENVTGTDHVKVYLDNIIIGESSAFPYSIDYKFTQKDVGNHSLRFDWKSYDKYGNVINEQTTYASGIIVSE